MKKGLRLSLTTNSSEIYHSNRRPDEEGIETSKSGLNLGLKEFQPQT